jgi:hypothetical protein
MKLAIIILALVSPASASPIYSVPGLSQQGCQLGTCDFGTLAAGYSVTYTTTLPALPNLPYLQTVPLFELSSAMGGLGPFDLTITSGMPENGLGFDGLYDYDPPLIGFGVMVQSSQSGDSVALVLDNDLPGAGALPYALDATLQWEDAPASLNQLIDKAAVPEPRTWVLVAAGLFVAWFRRLWKKRAMEGF